MSEQHKRKKARELLTKAGYSAGGHLGRTKDMIGEAVREHEKHDHPGTKPTRLKLKDGGNCDGFANGGRADRKPRGGAKGGKKGHTTVNVVVGAPHPKAVPVPVPVGGGPGGPAGAGGPPPGMPMPPPDGGGAPPMGLGGPPPGAKRGGRIGFKKGGKIKGYPLDAGSGSGPGRLEKTAAQKRR